MNPKPLRERFFSIPRPADWISPMTVCIAGISQGNTLIAVCDMMVSTGEFSADNMALKFRDIHNDWKAMFAGNDITQIAPLLEKAKRRLDGSKTRELNEVENVMRQCFQEELIRKQNDLVLARYGLNMQSFLDTGLNRFGEAVFTSMKYQLDQVSLACEFLVFGMDKSRIAHIFTVEDPGIVSNHDLYGFWAIGSGANRALSSLFFQQYRTSILEWEAIYYIAEAKFMAEGGSVGADSLIIIYRQDGGSVGSLKLDLLKALWKKSGRPKLPNRTEEIVAQSLREEFFVLSEPDAKPAQ
jgi:ATP-dependent protease HslVU (ClpYQ) peptidase subunit